ncbi:hypothetical protein [Rhodopirellula sp. P2]|uniref:hypothetical protein n=1 Tax=Rhodopirellula sp. P2 TaxID=2127060 RepID=UPI002367E493|nr:hypothetical protein [Rhodopirellula sp. P2]WDQ17022.1 hypothetical protein PSR62_00365 [Rhodopirellula sp. P2]
MNQSRNGIPIVQTTRAWRDNLSGYVLKPESSRTRMCFLITAGAVIAAVIDYRLFDRSIFRAVAEMIR